MIMCCIVILVGLGFVRYLRRLKTVVIDIQITLRQKDRDLIGVRVNRGKQSGKDNIKRSINSRERSGIDTIIHELNKLYTINMTRRDKNNKNVYRQFNRKEWMK